MRLASVALLVCLPLSACTYATLPVATHVAELAVSEKAIDEPNASVVRDGQVESLDIYY